MSIKNSRREFLKLSTIGASAAILFSPKTKAKESFSISKSSQLGLSILQGFTTETTAQLSIDVPSHQKISALLIDTDTMLLHEPHLHHVINHDKSDWSVHKVHFKNLSLGHKYLFHVLDHRGHRLDERELSTIDVSNPQARVAIVSCMFDQWPSIERQWELFDKADPDYAFFIGDAAYGDVLALFSGPNLLWKRFIETRQRLPFYHRRRLIPVHGTWDDHDYGKNEADYYYKYKTQSLKTYNAFFAQETCDDLNLGPGVSSSFDAFKQRFIFLDGRYFRNKRESDRRAYWSEEQLEWAHRLIKDSPYPIWLIQGCQYFDAYKKPDRSLENFYNHEFDNLKRAIASSRSPAIFISGDVHYSELMNIEAAQVGYETYEITSSSMHSFRWRRNHKNSRRVFSYHDDNFNIVDINPSHSGLHLDLQCLGDNKIRYSKKLIID